MVSLEALEAFFFGGGGGGIFDLFLFIHIILIPKYPPGDYSSQRLWFLFCHLWGRWPLTKAGYYQPNKS